MNERVVAGHWSSKFHDTSVDFATMINTQCCAVNCRLSSTRVILSAVMIVYDQSEVCYELGAER